METEAAPPIRVENEPEGEVGPRTSERKRLSDGGSGTDEKKRRLMAELENWDVATLLKNCPSARTQTSGGKKRQSGRRSSFVSGRISKALPRCADLCKQIPTAFPEADRLAKLLALAAAYTLDQLEIDFADIDDMASFKQNALDTTSATISELGQSGILKEAVCVKKYASNPVNEAIDQSIADGQTYKTKLEEEQRAWVELEAAHTREMEQALNAGQGDQVLVMHDRPDGLSLQQQKLVSRGSLLTDISRRLVEVQKQAKLATNIVRHKARLIEDWHDSSKKFIREEVNRIRETVFPDGILSCDPRQLIRDMTGSNK